MADYGIDAKPRVRGVSARSNRKKIGLEQRTDPVSDGFEDNDASELNIRVKDRMGDDVVGYGKKGRMGSIFKEAPIRGFKEGAADALKRPLTAECPPVARRERMNAKASLFSSYDLIF